MGRPLKISLFTRDDIRFPSPYIRLVQPLSFLKQRVSVSVDSGFVNGRVVINTKNWREADIVIVTRGFPNKETIKLVRKINASKKCLIYETDDAIPLIPDHHQKPWYKEAAPYIFECANLANVVTVSTKPLAQLFKTFGESVEVIENQLDPRIWTPDLRGEKLRGNSGIRIGIVGSKHHQRDFEILGSVVGPITEKHDSVSWVIYGDGASHLLEKLPASRCRYVPPNYDYESHPERLSRLRLDIGLCPLLDDDFNRCKSDIKYLEFGFLGTCGIYSKLPPYESSVSHEIHGLLCEWSEQAWFEAIETLIADENLRDELSQSAYASIQPRILGYDNNRWNQVLQRFV